MENLRPIDVAKYLCGECTDEEFAEMFVYLDRFLSSGNSNDGSLTKEDMDNFEVDDFTELLGEILDEIINNDTCNTAAWWKQE